MSDKQDIETKLAAARTRLILDKPFLGALVLRLPMMEADSEWCNTTATDARSFYYNHKYIESLTLDETQFVLAHEALHCALSHFARRQHRIKHRWDLACDYAINPLLVKDGLKPPPNVLYLDEYNGMTAEEIYPCVEDLDQETLDHHIYDNENERENDQDNRESKPQDKNESEGGDKQEQDENSGGKSKPSPLNETERQQLNVRWQQHLAGAAQQAIQAGKLDGAMARMIEHLLQPQLPWRMLLARYMTAMGRDDYSLLHPSTRREGSAIMPSLKSYMVNVTIVVDTSGSISDDELNNFITEINAIKGQMNARITLHACDNQLSENGPWTYEPWETFTLPDNMQGGGGTSFVPAFEWAGRQGIQPDLFVYFSDAEGEFPAGEPAFPVLWLIKGKNKTPWGERIQLN